MDDWVACDLAGETAFLQTECRCWPTLSSLHASPSQHGHRPSSLSLSPFFLRIFHKQWFPIHRSLTPEPLTDSPPYLLYASLSSYLTRSVHSRQLTTHSLTYGLCRRNSLPGTRPCPSTRDWSSPLGETEATPALSGLLLIGTEGLYSSTVMGFICLVDWGGGDPFTILANCAFLLTRLVKMWVGFD